MGQKQHTNMNSEARLLRINDVTKLTSLSKSCINLWVATNKFPEPITLCPTVKVWRFNDIVAWISEQSVKSKNLAAEKKSVNKIPEEGTENPSLVNVDG